jgi:hypothetical protein
MDDHTQGYREGVDGETFSGGSPEAFAGYLEGRKDSKENVVKPPRVDAVSFTGLACAYVVCLIYPVAGAAAAAALLLTWLVASMFGMAGESLWVLPLMLLAGLVAFFPGFAVEKRLAHRKSYRSLRNVYRIGVMALIPISMLMTTGSDVPDGGAIFVAFLMIPLGYWVLKRIDRAVGAAGAA